MEIRLATSSDVRTIKGLDEIARVDPRRQAFIDRSISERQCFVAILEGQVLGYGVLNYSFYDRGFVAMLYIDRTYRSRGIGSALLHHFVQLCETPTLFTSTNQSNTPMQNLLSKCGFVPSGVIENLDEGDPELVYVKRLPRL